MVLASIKEISRWVIIIFVLFNLETLITILFSNSLSKADVNSSNNKIGLFCKILIAKSTLWIWPNDKPLLFH